MTDTPPSFAQRPADLLSDLLDTVRLRGEAIMRFAPGPSFALEFSRATAVVHLFDRSGVELRIDGHAAPRLMHQGDIVLFPRPHRHTLSAGGERGARVPERRDLAGGTEPASTPQWLTGTYALNAPSGGPLMAQLPEAIFLSDRDAHPGAELHLPHRQLLVELAAPTQGSAVMVSRILDLLFIQVMRAWASRADADPSWVTAAMDPQVSQALAAIHADPAQAWTVAALAQFTNLSRSAFAERFSERTGQTPAAYIAALRLALAADKLRLSFDPIVSIAAEAGYGSNAAFTRAFTRRYGVSPNRFRADAGTRAPEPTSAPEPPAAVAEPALT